MASYSNVFQYSWECISLWIILFIASDGKYVCDQSAIVVRVPLWSLSLVQNL